MFRTKYFSLKYGDQSVYADTSINRKHERRKYQQMY